MTAVVDVAGYLLPLIATLALATLSWRTWHIDEPGVRWYTVLLAVFATATLAQVLLLGGLSLWGVEAGTLAYTVYIVGLFFYISAIIPWFLFALEYTGRVSAVPTGVAALVALPVVPFLHRLPSNIGVFDLPGAALTAHVNAFAWLYFAGLLAIGGYMILRTTHRYGHQSLLQGAVLIVAMVAPLVGQRGGLVLRESGGSAAAVTTALGGVYLFVGLCVTVAIYELDIFESTPAAGNVGERAIARDTDDVIVVTDHRNRIIKLNEAAADALGVTTTGPHGDRLSEVLDVGVEELQTLQTVELQTVDGKRQFDAQVSELTDQHDRWLGYLVSLRDVTDREIRKQRLQVLNRVLRHNLRNKLTVVRGRTRSVAEHVDDPEQEAHLQEAIEQADYLSDLGDKAKAIEELMDDLRGSRPTSETVDLPTLVAHVVADSREVAPDATFEVDVPDVGLPVDPALLEFALRNVVENAVEHADSETPRVSITATVEESAEFYPTTITVSDDGPGIPEHEIDVIQQGHETVLQHGSGLGLWVTNWALTELGGELSFEHREPSGTTVRIQLPRAPVPEGASVADERAAPDTEP